MRCSCRSCSSCRRSSARATACSSMPRGSPTRQATSRATSPSLSQGAPYPPISKSSVRLFLCCLCLLFWSLHFGFWRKKAQIPQFNLQATMSATWRCWLVLPCFLCARCAPCPLDRAGRFTTRCAAASRCSRSPLPWPSRVVPSALTCASTLPTRVAVRGALRCRRCALRWCRNHHRQRWAPAAQRARGPLLR